MDDNRTMRELAKEALAIQSCFNLSSIVHSFSRCICRLRAIAKEEGWEDEQEIRRHPISVLFSNRIGYLTYSTSIDEVVRAMNWAAIETTAMPTTED